MFNRILIANRGEIACRIMRTARQMGIETVAVYSSVDRYSEHAKQADKACFIGEAAAINSYLNIQAIIDAAVSAGAQAIHPGYGFLAENPDFASACATAGMIFIGPPVEALRAMASKQAAKQLLEKTAVPLTPGYHGENQDDAHLLTEAEKIGFPVLLKAAAGGGGKGMRVVQQSQDFSQALAGARREAKAGFADDTMIIEKLIANPRHIEVQIMADNFGNIVHLHERDCSVQRRHQKIIEEAPAAGLNKELRNKLATAACEVARTINYRGAGTIEFLVEDDSAFYFMEMNTRLQVEHPVTEMITGLDLVAWQLRIAANQPLPCRQEEIQIRGHALECRIYAEDPQQNFMPSIGRLHFLREPQAEGIRIDSGVTCGSAITQYYDPMIAKLIAWGETRDQALQRLTRALDHFAVGGVKTNLPFLRSICAHPRFIQADITTDFLNQEQLTLPGPDINTSLLVAAGHDYLELSANAMDPLLKDTFAWQMHLRSQWHQTYIINDSLQELTISPIDPSQFAVILNGQRFQICAFYNDDQLIIDDGKQQQSAWVEKHNGQLNIYAADGVSTVKHYCWENSSHATDGANQQLKAPMPSTVVAVLKKQGDKVQKGDPLLVLEAMKMEHTIRAPRDGTLADIFYTIGAQVDEGAELLTLEDSA